jgi:hypothetical protein
MRIPATTAFGSMQRSAVVVPAAGPAHRPRHADQDRGGHIEVSLLLCLLPQPSFVGDENGESAVIGRPVLPRREADAGRGGLL